MRNRRSALPSTSQRSTALRFLGPNFSVAKRSDVIHFRKGTVPRGAVGWRGEQTEIVAHVADVELERPLERGDQFACCDFTLSKQRRFERRQGSLESHRNRKETSVETHAMDCGRFKAVGREPLLPLDPFDFRSDEHLSEQIFRFANLSLRWRACKAG